MLLENVSVVTGVDESENAQTVNLENETNSEKDAADLIVLKGSFSTSDQSYKFEIKSDGTGKIFYSEYYLNESEEFWHEADLRELEREIKTLFAGEIELRKSENLSAEVSGLESARDEITVERLEEFFWEEINPTLEDPFFRSLYDDGDWGEEFQTERGTVDDLLEFLKLCALTEREISEPDDFLIVEAETEIDNACLSDCSYYTERLGELVEIACEYYKPSGFRYDYNDGCYDRQSGYCLESESISVSLLDAARAPVREKMLGMVRLKEKLVSMEIEEEKIKRLTAF